MGSVETGNETPNQLTSRQMVQLQTMMKPISKYVTYNEQHERA